MYFCRCCTSISRLRSLSATTGLCWKVGIQSAKLENGNFECVIDAKLENRKLEWVIDAKLEKWKVECVITAMFEIRNSVKLLLLDFYN